MALDLIFKKQIVVFFGGGFGRKATKVTHDIQLIYEALAS